MIFIEKEKKVYFIDFGLGFHSSKIEDKAVDLHLLRQALEAKHFKNWEILFKEVLKGYSEYKDSKKVLERFKAVERRGRYKRAY
jgi:Kae1-associated kinase Bud32